MDAAQNIVEQLKAAIQQAEAAGLTRYRISQIAGISQAQLSRLMNSDSPPRLDTAARIIAAMGGELRIHLPARIGGRAVR